MYDCVVCFGSIPNLTELNVKRDMAVQIMYERVSEQQKLLIPGE